jgi:hypothetical protein
MGLRRAAQPAESSCEEKPVSSIVFDHVSKRYSDGFEAAGPVAVKTPEAGGRSVAITTLHDGTVRPERDRHAGDPWGVLRGLSWCRGMARRSGR